MRGLTEGIQRAEVALAAERAAAAQARAAAQAEADALRERHETALRARACARLLQAARSRWHDHMLVRARRWRGMRRLAVGLAERSWQPR